MESGQVVPVRDDAEEEKRYALNDLGMNWIKIPPLEDVVLPFDRVDDVAWAEVSAQKKVSSDMDELDEKQKMWDHFSQQ